MGGVLFMAYQDMPDPVPALKEFIVDMEYASAGYTEDRVYALFDKGFY
jgi:hypothetical protein